MGDFLIILSFYYIVVFLLQKAMNFTREINQFFIDRTNDQQKLAISQFSFERVTASRRLPRSILRGRQLVRRNGNNLAIAVRVYAITYDLPFCRFRFSLGPLWFLPFFSSFRPSRRRLQTDFARKYDNRSRYRIQTPEAVSALLFKLLDFLWES